MRSPLAFALSLVAALAAPVAAGAEDGAAPAPAAPGSARAAFLNPPPGARLQMWYHWVGDCVTEEGLARDFAAMRELDVGTAHLFSVSMAWLPVKARTMSPEWLRLFAAAIREARKNGMTLGFHNCPGWSSSGGPWITPENSMQMVVASAADVDAGAAATALLPRPRALRGFYRDLAVYAFPLAPAPALRQAPPTGPLHVGQGKKVVFEVVYAAPFAPRAFVLRTAADALEAAATVEAAADGGRAWQKVGEAYWGLWSRSYADRVVKLRPVAADRFRVTLDCKALPDWVGIPDVVIESAEFTAAPMIDDVADKNSSNATFRRRHGDPAAPGVPLAAVAELTAGLRPDGTLDLSPLKGRAGGPHWRVVRVGHTTTGREVSPATVAGLECDKLDRRGLDAHWAAMPAKILALPGARETIEYCIVDSYEAGGQNWTGILPGEFAKRRGYPLGANLLSVCGYALENEAKTHDFLWDYQQTIAELFAENYYDRFAELCHAAGVKAIVEPYGGPFDPVRCGRAADVPTGEFWLGGPASGGPLAIARQVAMAHGQNRVAAEAFTTGGPEGRWQITPHQLRVAGDLQGWANGVNQLVFHSYVHQPFAARPGLSLGVHGTQFNRHTPWWPEGKWWSRYVRRGQALLQHGRPGRDDDGVAAPVLPGRLKALRREGAPGERLYFVTNPAEEPFYGAVGLVAPPGSLPEIFDAATGAIRPAPCVPGKEGRTLVLLDLAAQGSAFVVFSRGAAQNPAGLRAGENVPREVWEPTRAEVTVSRAAFRSIDDHAQLAEVTARVQALARQGGEFVVTSAVLQTPDPAPNHYKELVVDFQVDGGPRRTRVFPEHRPASLDFLRPAPRPGGGVVLADLSDDWRIVAFSGPNPPPAPLALPRLQSWSAAPDPRLRHFAGRATYRRDVPALPLPPGATPFLDLGEAHDVVNVTVNGEFVACLWEPPYRVALPASARTATGTKPLTLTLEVVNAWPNRLIGDARARAAGAAEPQAAEGPWPRWVLEGKEDSGTGIYTWSNWLDGWKGDEPLRPAGLLGPARIVAAKAER